MANFSHLLSWAVILASLAAGQSPSEYPQKIRTFYSPGDPRVPAGLMAPPRPVPLASLSALAVATDGAVWLGFPGQGLVRFDPKAAPEARYQYFAGRRYLPDDSVLNVVPDAARGVWVRTATGVSHIELRPLTLAQKAELFEQRIRERHDRYGLVASSLLREPGNLATSELEPSDNDGLWTAIYAAAECFRYAVTGSQQAHERARKAIDAVLFLEQVTGRPGFPARSFVRKGEPRPSDGVWHETADGMYQWKADTSSDEIVGHFFLFGVAWDLLPDDALKARIAATTRRILDHILAHGYNLTDVNGQPTTWGRWSPEYFSSPRGRPDSPLNALELLAFLRTAIHITGEPRYEAEYRKLALEMKYAELAARYLELCHEINYSDEELAMLSFYPLFRYEKDPRLLESYRRALDQWWKNIQREQNPLWTWIYRTGRSDAAVDVAGALTTLYRIPMDLVGWTVVNSHRSDVQFDPQPDRFGRRQALTLLPPDERPVMKWNGNPFRVDGGDGGRSEDDGAFFLLPYWLGRYQGVRQSSR